MVWIRVESKLCFVLYFWMMQSLLCKCQVTDLGAVLHMVGGTAASYMIFFLPGMLLINAAIVKRTASMANLEEVGFPTFVQSKSQHNKFSAKLQCF